MMMSVDATIGSEDLNLIIENILMINDKIDRASILQILERNAYDVERTTMEVQQLERSRSDSASTRNSDLADESSEGEDDDNEEFSDEEDDIDISGTYPEEFFEEVYKPPSRMPMMPFVKCNESAALACFGEEFSRRYNGLGAVMIAETLNDAIHEAFEGPVLTRKPLALYFHHDGSILANIFCSRYLTDELVLDILAQNYVFWAWDLTNDSKREELVGLCEALRETHLEEVSSYNPSQLPRLLLLSEADGRRAKWVSGDGSLENGALHNTLMEFFDDHQLRAQFENAVKKKQAPPSLERNDGSPLLQGSVHVGRTRQLNTSNEETDQSASSDASDDSIDVPDTMNEPDAPSAPFQPELS